jgi:hypothetical protein
VHRRTKRQQQQQQQASHIAMALTRRQKFLMLVLVAAAAKMLPRARAPNKHRDRTGAMHAVADLTDKQFKARFRMSRNAFCALLDTIRHELERDEAMARRSSGDPVFPFLKLCIALRYLAGGSYLDIADVYKVRHLCLTVSMTISHYYNRSTNRR